MNKIKYKIKEVKPKVFLVEFEDSYDMCMTFCRYQEFYESPSPKFRNKSFDIFDFIKWYSFKYDKGNFCYPTHWGGFNLPSNALERCRAGIDDYEWNIYDDIMLDITCKIKYEHLNFEEKYYLIGALKGNERTMRHEVAHAFFYLNKDYKKEMLALVKKLKPKFRDLLYKDLEKIGYAKQVFPDEAQAYLATGWRDSFHKLKNENKPFEEVFNKYYEQ